MIRLLIACAGLTAGPDVATPPTASADPSPRAAYAAESGRTGRDPASQVKLALWCEARGLEAEKLRHLALAVLADPKNAAARGLLGLASEGGRWASPDSVADRARLDERAATLRAEYDRLRDQARPTADDHARLADWCEDHAMVDEARAHLVNVIRLDPSRSDAFRKLGYRTVQGRWMTQEEVDKDRIEKAAQHKADRHWYPALAKAKADLASRSFSKRRDAERTLDTLDAPRAVPAIWFHFAMGDADDQARAVRLFSQVDSVEASKGLAAIAVFGESADVRRSAVETLRLRDLRGVIDPVIAMLRKQVRYVARPSEGVGSNALLLVEGDKANLRRIYEAPRSTPIRARNAGTDSDESRTERVNERLATDVQALDENNRQIAVGNDRAANTLASITGRDFGRDRQGWESWWADRQGYALVAAGGGDSTSDRPIISEFVSTGVNRSYDCFAAGTPVRTIEGPRPIESIRIGDKVLAQDATTGLLSYQPVLTTSRVGSAPTFRLSAGGEAVDVTGIHRFWKPGKGWVMVRDLKAGDPIRHLGGVSKVDSVEPGKDVAVFNLEVARSNSFFAGKLGALVHDGTLADPVSEPFDALAEQTAKAP